MKRRILTFFRIETLILITIIVAFSLVWIKWGKLTVYGWDLPFLYKKVTNISNTVLIFSPKDSPHLGYFIYIIPFLSIISFLFLMNSKFKTANFFLFLSTLIGFVLSLYMYSYMMSSKIFKLINTGMGLHLLCGISLFGLIYSIPYILRRKKKQIDELYPINTETINSEIKPENPISDSK